MHETGIEPADTPRACCISRVLTLTVNCVIAADAYLARVYADHMTSGGTTGPGVTPPENAPDPAPPPPAAPHAGPYAQRPHRGRGLLAGIGILVAIALAAAALVVSVTNTHETPAAQPAAPPADQPVSPTDADRALCEAIAPLIKESSAEAKAYTATGNAGTPARDAATPGFISQTNDWIKRAQPVLDQHAAPPRYLTRSLQRFIDDMHMFASSVQPGPSSAADTAAWNDSLVALSGPFEVCNGLGVPLW